MKMSEEKTFRIISEKPLITLTLRERIPIIPRPLRELWLGWAQEIETIFRNTEFIAGSVAYIGSLIISEMLRKRLTQKV